MRERGGGWSRRAVNTGSAAATAAAGAAIAPRRWGTGRQVAAVGAQEIDARLARLSLGEKVAQLFVFPAEGTSMTAAYEGRLAAEQPGGVILVGSNIGAADEVAAFVAAIKATNPALPPLVAVDQEGGLVARLAGDPAPAAPELGVLPPEEIAAWAAERAAFVAGFGFGVNFAPVADVAFGPGSFMAGRAFGSDPEAVAAAVAAYVEGAAGAGVVHCAKHFPGHGRASVDSHLALPEVGVGLAEWRGTDGLPFAAAVGAGVPMVMLGHLRYPAWDALPASISVVAVRVLREELGFEGVVATDDLGMAALGDYGALEVVDRAVAAGVDLLVYVTPAVAAAELIGHLVGRVEAGDVSEERIEGSVRRLWRVRG
jgi:beta-N-acetylhexosaminidase